MEDKKSKSRSHLPRTSRVSDKIIEYYTKFGHGRDLDKYMRFDSPGVSHSQQSGCSSTTTATTTGSSDEIASAMKQLFHLSTSEIDVEIELSTSVDIEARDQLIQMQIQDFGSKTTNENTQIDDMQTPPKATESKQTQTPDSTAKSHKRLEWDSLGDVGYRRSMSTSNVSELERSLLQGYVQDPSSSQSTHKLNVNSSENNLKTIHKEQREYATPPLASSTLAEEGSGKMKSRVRRKMISRSTEVSSTLIRTSEKYAQTRPSNETISRQTSADDVPSFQGEKLVRSESSVGLTSGELQSDLTSSKSALGCSVTPSSFEYFSSHSSRCPGTTSSSGVGAGAAKSVKSASSSLSNQFITSIAESLANQQGAMIRKRSPPTTSAEAAQRENEMAEMRDSLRSALRQTKNKENTPTISSEQLDLGIQLLCSLIDAKSLSGQEKKALVRDIMKRISRIYRNSSSSSSGTQRVSFASTEDSISANVPMRPSSGRCETVSERPIKVQNRAEPSEASSKPKTKTDDPGRSLKTSSNSKGDHKTKGKEISHTEKTKPSKSKRQPPEIGKASSSIHGKGSQISSKTVKPRHPATAAMPATTAKQQPSVVVPEAQSHKTKLPKGELPLKVSAKSSPDKRKPLPQEITRQSPPQLATIERRTTTASYSSTDASDTFQWMKISHDDDNSRREHATATHRTATESSSKEMTTQKTLNVVDAGNSKNADTNSEASMSEWLNPITQSEIEYEEQKRSTEVKSNASAKAKGRSIERKVQLNWIEGEINRLENLRQLLLESKGKSDGERVAAPANIETTASTPSSAVDVDVELQQQRKNGGRKRGEDVNQNDDKTYETVESDGSLSGSGKISNGREKQIEVIFESNDQVRLTSSSTEERSRGSATRETRRDDKKSDDQRQKQQQQRKQTIQRSKIATPSESPHGESVGSFVQQRKREFLDHYTKKKHEIMMQQQKQRGQSAPPHPDRPVTVEAATQFIDDDHYSIPHTMQRMYPMHCHHQPYYPCYCRHHYAMEPPQQIAPPLPPPPPPPPPSIPPVASGPTGAHDPPVTRIVYKSKDSKTTPKPEQGSSSSSSSLQTSSEMSVPMGSADSSSASTTTHQYDDVAGGGTAPTTSTINAVGVQTGDSDSARPPLDHHCHCRMPSHVEGQCRCVQSKKPGAHSKHRPKAIAYCITFDKRSEAEESLSDNKSNIDATTADQNPPTLQDYLAQGRPRFLANVNQRMEKLSQMHLLRQQREQELRNIVENTSINSLDRKLQHLPPPPIKLVRIFHTKEMKAMTIKRCLRLPEVMQKREREREERRRQGNRLISSIFSRRLQRCVRKGELSLNHSRTVI